MNPGRVVEQWMFRGMGGDLIRGPRFAQFRATQADIFVFFSYAAVFVVSIILNLTTTTFVLTLFLYVLWTAFGYVFIALGTKLAHNFATWGIALVAAVLSLGGVWGSIVRLSADQTVDRLTGEHIDNPGVLAVQLIIYVALAAAYGYLTFVMARFVNRMSTVGFTPPLQNVPAPPIPFGPPQDYSSAPVPQTSFAPPSLAEAPLPHATPGSPPNLTKSAPPQAPPAPPVTPVALEPQGGEAPTRAMVVPPLLQSNAPTSTIAPPPVDPPPVGPHPSVIPPVSRGGQAPRGQPLPAPTPGNWSSQPPTGWQQSQAPVPTGASNGFVSALASAVFLLPLAGAYWAQDLATGALSGDAYDWFGPAMWALPSAVVLIAVLVRARPGRRLGATVLALLTLAIVTGLYYTAQLAELTLVQRDALTYALTVIPAVGAVTAWGVARRRGAIWVVAVPLVGGISALWTWIVWVDDDGNTWIYPLVDHWWGFGIVDLWPTLLGILLAWILDASTRPRPGPTFQPDGRAPIQPHNGYGPAPFAGSGPLYTDGTPYPLTPPTAGNNPLAIAALFSSFVFAPLGVVFGHIAIHQIGRTAQRGRGLAVSGLVIGYTLTTVAIATWITLLTAFNSTDDSFASSEYETTATTDYTQTPTPTVPASGTSGVIRNAQVGDCLHVEFTGETNADGSRAMKATTATCSTAYATNKVSTITTDSSMCAGAWIRTSGVGSDPDVVLCLLEGGW